MILDEAARMAASSRFPTIASAPSSANTHAMKGYVYILASRRNGTLYTGVTTNPSRRLLEHTAALTPSFTSRYGVKTLVWIEEHDLVVDAIQREKSIKKYPRRWKLNLIEALNPDWRDLSDWLIDT
jgi:putative endonuclease